MKVFEKSGDTLYIDYLCRHAEYADTVAQWIYSTFVINSPRTATLDKIVQNFKSTSETEWPVTFVAIEGGRCVGTVSIFGNDLKTQSELKPWLAAIIVSPEFRKQGIGSALISRACSVAKALGYGILYLRTEHAAQYYERLGWEFVGHAVDEYGIDTDVYKCHLV